MASRCPRALAPLLRTATLALLDETLPRAFRSPRRGAPTSALVRRAVRTRGRFFRLLPPRRGPHFARQDWEVKGCPNGCRVADLGTRPVPGLRGCPVRHRDSSAAGPVE
ncbi:hypothetical protein AB0H04_36855 [Streptomyces flaveolus]|uniref:Uncharacterized protein n=1 Tax=Streptomyces flaveolus TaxID=67297 RepID=A0ABV3AK76_9ACTN|nr:MULTISPECIES: hypothetical protein [unclassified Streptomyces]